ncbi:MAG: cupredoxin domain-containing protein [Candidatus Limnocylindrales bacterium]
MRRLALTLLIAVSTAGLAACGGSATQVPAASTGANPTAAASAAPSTAAGGSATTAACATAAAGATAAVTVSIKNFAYTPQPVQAKVGDVVAWKNDDNAPHSATMDTAGCDTDTIATGLTAMLVFTAAGTYTYHCKIHPGQMKDVTVEVK